MIKPKAIIESNRRYVLIPGAEDDGLLDSATLNLDFQSGILDSRIDFQRTTAGTFYRGQFNQNLVTYSQQPNVSLPWVSNSGGGGSASNPVVTTTSEPAPDGTSTAFRVTFNKTGGTFSRLEHPLSVGVVGQTYTLSVWLKANTANGAAAIQNVGIRIGNDPSGFNCVVTTSWQRFSYSYTVAATATNAQIMLWDSITGNDETADVFVWGVQLTEGSLLTPYIPTTTAAITQGQIASSAPWNLLLRSQEFDNTTTWTNAVGGTGVNPVRTANNAVAPDGTTTADTVTFDTGAGTTSSNFCLLQQTSIGGVVNGQSYTFSFWIRGTVGGEKLTVRGVAVAAFTLITATTSWQRISITSTAAAGTVQMGIYQSVSGHGVINSTATVELWGAQLNQGSSALEYRSTTSSALWLPRFQNNPVTGDAEGLLIEGGATNLCLQSADLATTWTNDNTTEGANVITAPDGTVSADSLIDTATTTTHGIFQTISGQSTTATYTISAFLKKGTVRYVCLFNNLSGASQWGVCVDMDNPTQANLVTGAVGAGNSVSGATITNVGNGWYRVSVTGVSAITAHYPAIAHRSTVYSGTGSLTESYAGVVTNLTYVWGFQYEQQAFASSYIPTTTASVARGADSAVMSGTNFSSWYNQSEGTVLAKWKQWNVGGNEFSNAARFALSSGLANSLWIGKQNTAGVGRRIEFEMRDSSGAQRVVSVANPVTDPIITAAGAQKFGDTFGMSYNGTTTVSTAQIRTPAPDRLFIGSYDLTSGHINSTLSRLAYWPTRLPDATLQSLTT